MAALLPRHDGLGHRQRHVGLRLPGNELLRTLQQDTLAGEYRLDRLLQRRQHRPTRCGNSRWQSRWKGKEERGEKGT